MKPTAKKNSIKKSDEILTETVMLRLTKKEKRNLEAKCKKAKKSFGRCVAVEMGL
jgi:hypothetical protein